MKHLEMLSKGKSLPPRPRGEQKPLSVSRQILIALAIISGIGYGMTTWWSRLPADHLTEKEKAELVAGFTHLNTVTIERIKDEELQATLDNMRLEPSAKQALKQNLASPSTASQTTVLARVRIWDFASQDGDVVRLSSAGYSIDVALLNDSAIVALPIDASQSIQITGIHDGGGGITLGLQNGTGKISLPVLTEGQSINLPVNY